ncbi:putative proline-rich receptor-like protein kinase PERK3 [Iris pallida]|uniref:Proline-rich receptor-like protein kinase PERK3 n=1 Tax=Iris pallida TaxID=29817 RepID=A0AAX6E6P1_IRIPA|nr:putative proline-rich receptor-like protein kinase PERK3 [Iris pallida]
MVVVAFGCWCRSRLDQRRRLLVVTTKGWSGFEHRGAGGWKEWRVVWGLVWPIAGRGEMTAASQRVRGDW